MDEKSLHQLLSNMTLEEKARLLWQPVSRVFDPNGVLTGNDTNVQYTADDVHGAGSTLNVYGIQQIHQIQEEHIAHHPHHIPMIFMGDIIHGFATILPLPLAQSCSFNPELVKEACRMVANESAASGVDVTFFPMIDLVRDPRWGRVTESAGEDPYLAGVLCSAMVKGFQGEDNDLTQEGTIAACVKHFGGYGAAEGGRDYNSVEVSERTLRQYYFPGYEEGVKAGAKLIMTSYNTLGGVPSSGNRWLLRDVLRRDWSFTGTVISDLWAVDSMKVHGVSANDRDGACLSLNAGVDIEMGSFNYLSIPELVREGIIDEATLDTSVMNVLRLINDLGLFERPYRFADVEKAKSLYFCPEHMEIAKRLSSESCVLLENQDDILPLSEKDGKIAFIGPFIDDSDLDGAWSITTRHAGKAEELQAYQTVSLHKELVKRFPNGDIVFASGCKHLGIEQKREADRFGHYGEEDREQLISEAVEVAKGCSKVVLTLGELPRMSGEANCRSDIRIPDIQQELLDRIYEVNKNIVVLLYNGRPLDLREVKAKSKAILDVWFLGTTMSAAIVDLLYGLTAPSGRLTMAFPYSVGQIPIYYNHLPTDHRNPPYASMYNDCPLEPLYPFGYGLTYTHFKYGNLRMSHRTMKKGESIIVSVDVTNCGLRDCFEVVQMYIHDCVASVSRPVKELKGFQKVLIKAGDTASVSFAITKDMLRYYNVDMAYISDPGEFEVFIGGNSAVSEHVRFTLEN